MSNAMITSLNNGRVKAARKLHTRQQRRRSGSFLLEGMRLIGDALQSGVVPEVVFHTPDVTAQTEGETILAAMHEKGVECIPVSEQVVVSLAQTVTPQGIVAVARIPHLPFPEQPALLLVLDGVSDPGNAGTLLRGAEAAGVAAVIFGPDAVDPFNDKVVRAGMGAHLRLPLREHHSWAEVESSIADAMGPRAPLYAAEADAPLAYDGVDWTTPAVLVVGSEAKGLSEAARRSATPVSIPMRGRAESLNAAMAGTVIMFEAARQRRNYVQRGVDTCESSGVS